MGFIRVMVKVFAPADSQKSVGVEALVDTGAVYTVLPRRVLESLGVMAEGRRAFRDIRRQRFEREIGSARIEVQGQDSIVPVPVIFGQERDSPVLGVAALEVMGLEADPARGELRPTEFLLLTAAA